VVIILGDFCRRAVQLKVCTSFERDESINQLNSLKKITMLQGTAVGDVVMHVGISDVPRR
jgi:hypothetical protein